MSSLEIIIDQFEYIDGSDPERSMQLVDRVKELGGEASGLIMHASGTEIWTFTWHDDKKFESARTVLALEYKKVKA